MTWRGSHDPGYKCKILTGFQPTEEEMDDIVGEAVAIQMAMDDVDEDDEVELAELSAALRNAVSRVRLNLYRLGRDPSQHGMMHL